MLLRGLLAAVCSPTSDVRSDGCSAINFSSGLAIGVDRDGGAGGTLDGLKRVLACLLVVTVAACSGGDDAPGRRERSPREAAAVRGGSGGGRPGRAAAARAQASSGSAAPAGRRAAARRRRGAGGTLAGSGGGDRWHAAAPVAAGGSAPGGRGGATGGAGAGGRGGAAGGAGAADWWRGPGRQRRRRARDRPGRGGRALVRARGRREPGAAALRVVGHRLRRALHRDGARREPEQHRRVHLQARRRRHAPPDVHHHDRHGELQPRDRPRGRRAHRGALSPDRRRPGQLAADVADGDRRRADGRHPPDRASSSR